MIIAQIDESRCVQLFPWIGCSATSLPLLPLDCLDGFTPQIGFVGDKLVHKLSFVHPKLTSA